MRGDVERCKEESFKIHDFHVCNFKRLAGWWRSISLVIGQNDFTSPNKPM
jgi:hypothetical protein